MVTKTQEVLAETTAALLQGLGDTADAVAVRLRSAGARGRRRSSCECPVAIYLQSRMSDRRVDLVMVRRLDVGLGHQPLAAQSIPFKPVRIEAMVDLPGPVREFVHCFDAGDFPELELVRT